MRIITHSNKEELPAFDPSLVSSCFFLDRVLLCCSQGFVRYGEELTLPCLLHNTTFRNCYVFASCHIMQNTLIENTVILPNTIMIGCGRITCRRILSYSSCSLLANSTFGNGIICNMGNETGGLQIPLTADLLYNDLEHAVRSGLPDPSTYMYNLLFPA